MSYSVHPVLVTREDKEIELLFMTEDDAFAFAKSLRKGPYRIAMPPSIRLNETVKEGQEILKQMLGG